MTSTTRKRKTLLPLLLLFLVIFLYRPRDDLKKTLDNVIDELALLTLSEIANLTRGLGSRLTLNPCKREWILPPGQDWPTLNPNEDCSIVLEGKPSLEICHLISGKRLLFVGPDTTYHLHSLWLDSLESHEKRSHRCLGRDYCTFHHICRPPASTDSEDLEEHSGRKKKLPQRSTLLAHNSSLLQYALSTTLYASLDKQDAAYSYPTVDTQTRIRTSNTFWLRQARKSDIIIMNRGPVPAPASTYPIGDWTFAQILCRNVNYLSLSSCDYDLEHLLANAAIHATIDSFLPGVLRTLRVMSIDRDITDSLIFWHGSWFIQPLCAKTGLPKGFPLLRDIYSNSKVDGFIDSWSLYYNSQGMHGIVLNCKCTSFRTFSIHS